MKNIVKNNKGFSLVELLVVIAVIGIIAAIAIPAMSGIFDKSRETKARKNAQALVSTLNGAKAAGVDTSSLTLGTTGATAAPAIATFFATARTGTGVMSSSKFSVAMSSAEAGAAGTYITVSGGEVIYTAAGDS